MAGRQWIKEALKDFVFSFSEGASAAARTPGVRGGAASLAASIAAPQKRQDMIRLQGMEDEEQTLKIQQIKDAIARGQFGDAKQRFDLVAGLPGEEQSIPDMQAPNGLNTIKGETLVRPHAPMQIPGVGNVAPPTAQDLAKQKMEQFRQQQQITADENIRQTNATRPPQADTNITPFDLWRQQNPGASIMDWIDLNKPKTEPAARVQQHRELEKGGRRVLEYFDGADPSKVTFTVDMGPVKDKSDDPLTAYQRNQTFIRISDKYQADPIVNVAVKGQTAKAIADQIIKNPEKATNQLSALYLYVKNLDPDSAVREGETALAQQTQSYFQKFSTSLRRLEEGAILGPQAAKDLAAATKELVTAWEGTAKTRTGQYKSQAGTAGVGPQFDQYLAGFGGIAGSGNAGGAPAGVDPALWNVMTPQERALWRK